MTIKDLKPSLVWGIFHKITQVPRPSKKEGKIRAFLIDFAQKHNLQYKTDDAGNVAIFRPASPGCEGAPRLVLQGHMDMVCEKNPDVNHDFDNDPITTIIDGEWVHANGTTLGADNGIGMAAGLATLIDPSIVSGPIQALFTVDEETGLTGANALGEGMIDGDILLNLDSEEDGEICIGCCGGIGTNATFTYTPTPAPDYVYFNIKVSGLNGGHSGSDINAERGCANKILARLLYNIGKSQDYALASFNGGNLRNAIARDAEAVIGICPCKKEELSVLVNTFDADVKNEFKRTEPNVYVAIESVDKPQTVIDPQTARNFVSAMYCAPHGVLSMSKDIEGLVETSTNLASAKMKPGNTIEVITSQRSSVESRKFDAAQQVETVFALAGATVAHTSSYPGWAPNMESPILNIASQVHQRLFGTTPKATAIHAGLECGLFLTNYPHLDMISYGPTLRGVHSPSEKMHIPAVERFWNLTVAIIEEVSKLKR
ncbi:MAG: aminoacyl-histidine dipeptidase [Muribaculaceae bacterium]